MQQNCFVQQLLCSSILTALLLLGRQDLQGLSSRAELEELLALARARLAEPWASQPAALLPPLGFFFDPLPSEGGGQEPGAGEKRKRVMIDDYEMEGGEGGDLNVTRLVRDVNTVHACAHARTGHHCYMAQAPAC